MADVLLQKLRKRIGKKGNIQDLIFIMVVLFFFSVVVLIAFKIVSEFNTTIQGVAIIPQRALDSTNTLQNLYPGIIDNAYLFFAIGAALVMFVLAALVRVHPMFAVFFFIGLIVIIFVGGALSNVYQEMASTSGFQAQADQLIFISHIMTFLPFVIGIFGFILMIVMFKIFKNE